MTRRCSHCSNNGHNSRTCPARSGTSRGGVVKLFGVKISGGGLMKKSASMGNISNSFSLSASPKNFASWGSPSNDLVLGDGGSAPSGYASDDPNQASCSSSRSERRKGLPWTEEEHRMFLTGLRRLGKGDWRGIARNFVMSRTPTQVASHAQKYFIRQSNLSRRKRRSSLFDMVPDLNIDKAPIPEEDHAPCSITGNPDDPFPTPLQNLYLEREISHPELSSASPNPADVTRDEIQCSSLLPMVPGFYPAYIPTSLSLWPSNADEELAKRGSHGLPKNHASVDQLEKISDLRLGDSSVGSSEPSTRSLELAGSSPTPRQPALSQNQDSVVHAL